MKSLILLVAFLLPFNAQAISQKTYDVNGVLTHVENSFSSLIITHTPEHLPFSGQWSFLDHHDGSASLEAYLDFGNYETRTITPPLVVIGIGAMDGTVSVEHGIHQISGTGSWNGETFLLEIPTGAPDSGIASSYSEAGSSCQDAVISGSQSICSYWEAASPEWEGLYLELVFSNDLSSFTGQLIAIERSGSFLVNQTTLDFSVSGLEVPLPAAGWLFLSGIALLSLARKNHSIDQLGAASLLRA